MRGKVEHTINASSFHVMLSLVVHVGVVEHGFGGYAADVEARPTKGTTLLNAGCLCRRSELGAGGKI
jgi:hypothetical protein